MLGEEEHASNSRISAAPMTTMTLTIVLRQPASSRSVNRVGIIDSGCARRGLISRASLAPLGHEAPRSTEHVTHPSCTLRP